MPDRYDASVVLVVRLMANLYKTQIWPLGSALIINRTATFFGRVSAPPVLPVIILRAYTSLSPSTSPFVPGRF
jgi:hypothetical protein